MEKITLTNSFHNTKITVKAATVQAATDFYFSNNGKLNSSGKRIQKALCGVSGCTCGDFLGTR